MSPDGKVNILLVDDQPAKLLGYEVILAELGENLIKANSAKEALQHLLKSDVAVVLLDACMPEMDGFELAQMIRNHPRCDRTAIILVSAIYLSDFDRLRGYGCGAVDYVPVPVNAELLRAKVGIFADLFRKTEQLSRLNLELERRVAERTAELEASTSELRASEAKFRRTFECNMLPMGIWTADGAIGEANDALLELIRRDRADLDCGKIRVADILSSRETALDEQFWREVREQGVGTPHERSLLCFDGRSIPVLFGGASFGEHIGRGVFFAFDLSERKRGEEDRARLLESERVARSTAEQANRLKDEFLAMLSHELRTPISAVLGWVQLMRRGTLSAEDSKEGLRVIERGVRSQVRLIDELLDVNRITSGKFHIHKEAIDLSAVLRAAIETIEPQAAEKRVALRKSIDAGSINLLGDATRIQQVFWNLLTNAIKFTPESGIVEVCVETDDREAKVTVRDNGQGIDAKSLPHVFEPFRQGDSSITRRHEGLGLGLAIAKHIVELHEGSISAQSNGAGSGSCFTLTLPISSAVVAPRGVEAGDLADYANRLSGVRALVVDDDAATRDIVARTLADGGAETLTVAGADQAFEAIVKWRPNLVVCDIGMPTKDGYTFIRELRTQGGAHSDLPALALTAYTRPEDCARALGAGFDLHLAKPVNPNHLLAAVCELAPKGLQPLESPS